MSAKAVCMNAKAVIMNGNTASMLAMDLIQLQQNAVEVARLLTLSVSRLLSPSFCPARLTLFPVA